MERKLLPKVEPDRLVGIGWQITTAIASAANSEFSEEERSLFATDASRCHCGHCRRYARCKFTSPRGVWDALHNVNRTGSKAGVRIAAAGSVVDHYDDDVVLSFGIGAGSCVLGWKIARGYEIEKIFGCEVEPVATRIVRALFPTATIAQRVQEITIPPQGRLIVISSLVFNLISVGVAYEWSNFLAEARGQFLHVNVGREEDPGKLNDFESRLQSRGFSPEVQELPRDIDADLSGYTTRATWWCRHV